MSVNTPETIHNPAYMPVHTVGIGREVSEEWLTQTVGAFERLATGGLSLALRTTPAINYVTANELATLSSIQTPQPDYIAAQADVFLSSITAQQGVAVTTTVPIMASINRIRFQSKTKALRIEMLVLDQPSDEYPSGRLIEGEKMAIRDALDLPPPKRCRAAHKAPNHWLKLGLINGEISDVRAFEQAFRAGVPRKVPLLGVGAVHL